MMYTSVRILSNHLILWQFHSRIPGDYITIYDVTDYGNIVIASLTNTDFGPQSYHPQGRWQKKIISSTSNNMLVEFRGDEYFHRHEIGFSTSIHYSPLPSEQCEKGLDMTMKTIQSPNYPDSYDNNLSCKWLISVPHGSHITLKFLQFDVSLKYRLNKDQIFFF